MIGNRFNTPRYDRLLQTKSLYKRLKSQRAYIKNSQFTGGLLLANDRAYETMILERQYFFYL